ncbi:MAG: Bax inhibitor-1/YccA family protein [Spirochaetaceae bacterium]|nr:MAG: Bax inhibitor-1/YccA family protein [Spirochaetaceae bacterium]
MNQTTHIQARARSNSVLRTVYIYMTAGLAITGVVAFLAANTGIAQIFARNTMLFILLLVGQLALVLFLSARIRKLSPQAALGAFFLYASLNGILFSYIFLIYTGVSIALTFFITAGTFAGMSIYALTTKEDLTKYGRFLIMGLWGIILASLANWLFKSPALYWIITYAGVLVFVGLTAYDTQVIARWSNELPDNADTRTIARLAIIGALRLYLDFINLFLMLLRIFGGRR